MTKYFYLKNKILVTFYALFKIIQGFTFITAGVISMYMANAALNKKMNNLLFWILIDLSIIMTFIFFYLLSWLFKWKLEMKGRVFLEHLLNKKVSSMKYYEYQKYGENYLLNVYKQDIPTIVSNIIMGKIDIFITSLIVIYSFGSLFWINWIIGFVSIFYVLITFIFGKFVANKLKLKKLETSKLNQEYISESKNMIEGINSLMLLGKENNIKPNIHKFNTKIYKSIYKISKYINYIMGTKKFINSILSSIIVLSIALIVYKWSLKPGIFISVIAVNSSAHRYWSSLNSIFISFESSKIILKKINAIKGTRKIFKIIPIRNKKEIKVKNISFKYNDKLILNDISVTFKNKNKYAIIGKNGSGKSTLIKLLLGLIDPSKGTLSINGTIYSDMSKSSILSNFSYAANDLKIINGNLMKNIIFFDKKLNKEKYKKALNQANINFDSKQKNIHNLSDGQKARIIIARALYQDNSILIFDETFTNIDENNKNIIMNNLMKLDKMIIFISHHLKKDQLEKFQEVIKLIKM